MSAGDGFAGVEAAGMLLGGLLERSSARAQARVLEENARLSLLEGEEAIAQTLRQERQVSGAAVAAMAGSGARVGTGTAADIIRQNGLEREIEIGNIRAQAQGQARNQIQAAEDLKASGDHALFGALAQAGTHMLSYKAQVESRATLDAQVAKERAARLEALRVKRAPTANPAAANGNPFRGHPQPNPHLQNPAVGRRFGVLGLPGAY